MIADRRLWTVALLAGVGAACASAPTPPRSTAPPPAPAAAAPLGPATFPPELLARARELTRRVGVIDTHIDVPYRLRDEPADVAVATADGDFDFPRARAGGLAGAFMSVYVPSSVPLDGSARALADQLIDLVLGLVARAPEKFALAASPDAIAAAHASGRVALPMGMENGSPIEHDLANLAHFHARGIRYITLTHGADNQIGDSSYSEADQRKWHGLSPFGRQVVSEMNRLGILIDISHVSDETFDQVAALSRAPLIASHSSCRHFTPGFERNLDDDRIRRLAAGGGVIQINFGSSFLTAAARAHGDLEWPAVDAYQEEHHLADGAPEIAAFRAQYRRDHPYPYATLDDVVAHIEHVVALVGIDHVGIGSDFDGVGDSLPVGLKDVSQYPNLAAALLARGHSEADVAKVLGGNLLRVWREVERVAQESGSTPPAR